MRSQDDEKSLIHQDVVPITGTYDHYGTGGRRPAELPRQHLFDWRSASAWVTAVPAALTLVMGGAFLGRPSMWSNEAATWISSIQPLSHIVRNSGYLDVMYLPYYLFMHFWLGVSQSLAWMRLPSLLAGAAAVQALVLLARRWLPLGWSVLAGLLLALNPLFAAWTIAARPYTAAALFAVLSTAALMAALDRRGTGRWVLYGLASLCMLLLHLMAALVLAAQLVAVVIARRRSAFAGMASTLVCVAVAVSPLAVAAARETKQISWIGRSSFRTFHWALYQVSGGRDEAFALVTCGIILMAGLVLTPRNSDRALGFALSLAWGALPVLLLVLAGFLHPVYVPRYTVVCLPGVALIEAFAGWRVWTILAAKVRTRETSGLAKRAPTANGFVHRHDRQRWVIVTATITCCAVCVAGLALLLSRTFPILQQRYYTDDYRSAAAALSRDLSERPAPIAVIPTYTGVGFSYYVTPSALARALSGQAIRAYNQHSLYWLAHEPSSVVGWPIGAKPPASKTRCAVGWAIGRGKTPSKTLIIDGSRCQVYQFNRYGAVWIASVRAATGEPQAREDVENFRRTTAFFVTESR